MISIVISAILAVVGVVLSVYALNKAFTHFASDSDHIRKYAKRYNQQHHLIEPASSLPTRAQRVVDVSVKQADKKAGPARRKTRIVPYQQVPNEGDSLLHARNPSAVSTVLTNREVE